VDSPQLLAWSARRAAFRRRFGFDPLGGAEIRTREDVSRIVITASGGPFRTWAPADIEQATLEQALKHPNWSMGRKITIDSASMMNKGLELIEAHLLFRLPSQQIEIVVHPQSVIHSMVAYRDGSVLAFTASDPGAPSALSSAPPTARRFQTPEGCLLSARAFF